MKNLNDLDGIRFIVFKGYTTDQYKQFVGFDKEFDIAKLEDPDVYIIYSFQYKGEDSHTTYHLQLKQILQSQTNFSDIDYKQSLNSGVFFNLVPSKRKQDYTYYPMSFSNQLSNIYRKQFEEHGFSMNAMEQISKAYLEKTYQKYPLFKGRVKCI